MSVKIKFLGKYYRVRVFDNNGKLLHDDCCYPYDLERMINELSTKFCI